MKWIKANFERIEALSGLFLIISLFLVAEIYGSVQKSSPMEKIDEIIPCSEELSVEEAQISNSVNIPRSEENNPCGKETDNPCGEEGEIERTITFAESILSAIDNCEFIGSQQSADRIIYTVGITVTSDKSKLKSDINNACYLIRYNCLFDSDIKHITILAVKKNKPQTVVLMCKDNQILVDNL